MTTDEISTMTNREFYFGDDLRLAASLKLVTECCNKTDCLSCILQEICCQPPGKFLAWLDAECPEASQRSENLD